MYGYGTCPICGKSETTRNDASGNHRCDPKTLARIDGAMKRTSDAVERRQTFTHRLSIGFFMLSLNEA